MSDARTPAEIARGLSAAQRKMIGTRKVAVTITDVEISEMYEIGLLEGHILAPTITPLGLLVRTVLAAIDPPPAASPFAAAPKPAAGGAP